MKFWLTRNNENRYNIYMDIKVFEILKEHNGTHKKAAASIGLSYTRYNEWRWDPIQIPAYGKKLLQLAVEKLLNPPPNNQAGNEDNRNANQED